ncbi:MAG TPA: DUF1800 domain-containing protein [Vicinamibacterales bacterium]|nr:DUF1800 domain-containing protein [Vicinamibacterales bacterium]
MAPFVEHLFRRAAFGLSPVERDRFARGYSDRQIIDSLLVFDAGATDVDGAIGTPGHVGVTIGARFTPNTNINQARQRWLFRMVHSPAPLQERMALIWHHHFATAQSKIAGVYGGADSTRLLAAKPSEDPTGHRGQIELFRQYALGRFEDLLVEVAKDPAMLVWLDGRLNVKGTPQENFGRELMELFTVGVGFHTEEDVYAAARVFTGWNLRRTNRGDEAGTASYEFNYRAAQHETGPKEFSFAIYPSGPTPNRIPARSAADGLQDGLDLIHALAVHPETARRMARRLWTWFVSETAPPDEAFVASIARVYLDGGTQMRPVLRAVLTSPQFGDERNFHQRYSWPVEYAVRTLKEVGYLGFSVGDLLTPLLNMGQQLFEPPDVNGWALGPGWFSTSAMLSRMNFASQLATNQRVALRDAARAHAATPEALVDFVHDTLTLPDPPPPHYQAALDYVRAGGAWTGSDAQLLARSAGLFHLLAGSAEYQFL